MLEERRGRLDEHIRAASELTESQKRSLLEIYQAFVSGGQRPQNTTDHTSSSEQE
jgi:hypothetical protein